jgi:predicted RNA-binding protein with PIN domain
MPYIIDGNNLIGHAPDLELGDPGSRAGLISRLLAFQRATRKRIMLVFDGPAGDAGTVPVNAKFTIHTPAAGQSADDVIIELLARLVDRRNVVVVSTDREIRDAARARGVRTITSPEFARELRHEARAGRRERELDKRVAAPTPLETRLWDEVFRRRT